MTTPEFGETEASVRVLGSGPPLLLVHGLMTTSYSWRYVFERLAQDYTVYAMDLPGVGRTSKPDVAYTPDALAEWLHALQAELGIAPCRVIGNSMGGYITLIWALKHPEAISRLIVLHSPAAPLARMWALWAATRIPFAVSVLKLVVGDHLRWAHRNVHYYDETLKSLEEAHEYGDPLSERDGLIGFLGHLRDTMSVRRLGQFRDTLQERVANKQPFPVPTQLIYAKQDPMVPPEIGHRLASWIPDAEMVWLDEASHFAHVDAPERFLEPTLRFLAAAQA